MTRQTVRVASVFTARQVYLFTLRCATRYLALCEPILTNQYSDNNRLYLYNSTYKNNPY